MERTVTLTAMCFLCAGTVELSPLPESEALALRHELEVSERVRLFTCPECWRQLWGEHYETAVEAGLVPHPH